MKTQTEPGIGARDADVGANSTGVAYVFTRTNGIWTEQTGDQFGWSVSVSGDTAAAGTGMASQFRAPRGR